MATPSSSLAWRIPWTKEPGRLQSIVSQSQTSLKGLSPVMFTFFILLFSKSTVWTGYWTKFLFTILSPLSLHYQEWFKERVWIVFRNLLPGLVLRNKKIPFEIRKINPTWFLDPLSSNLWPFWRKTFIFSSMKRAILGYTEVKIYKVLLFSMLSSVQSLSRVRLFVTPWITAHQASLSITNFRS